ncbi:hypothetical protein ABXV20_05195 [Bacillus paranthracis]|uniref:Lipoprotein n=1 Tax=Bacillus cytotoxicus (strain DSM 22905 / CIP 110041 / 391-98 / NVH 391-98) TaxID=315749 RepID=A7GVL6_BACCN|nr:MULTISPECIES: hypothetical protein [Bacillus cereus group]KKZ99663.1 hypothetical protein B4086_5418 [Bacillus cereus]HDX9572900.1 hypothetical protein [Bacillus mobilis]ABS24174.1 hypothetical protein Bcer98_3993 [Bacillus cytotoxicus NVH 391-98]AWC46766.1 hypothetical protein CG479_021130 [Bacillus cytotoxicus]MCC2358805.1 hypothetical protein [Bacillus paranthracis]
MVKKWGAILLIVVLMNGCSAKTDENVKEEESKNEQTEEIETKQVTPEQKNKTANIPSNKTENSADERLVNGLNMCVPLFKEVKEKVAQSNNLDKKTIDPQKVEEAIAKSEEIYKCIENNMNDLSGTIQYSKTRDTFFSSIQELIKFKNKTKLFLQNNNFNDYIEAMAHFTKALEKIDETVTVYQEEQKQ